MANLIEIKKKDKLIAIINGYLDSPMDISKLYLYLPIIQGVRLWLNDYQLSEVCF